MLKFKNISKNYKAIKALKNVSFSIPENSIFGILGANGSGKSTFMKILPGLIYNWTGEIYYHEKLINQKDMLLKKDFGYLIESPTFYEYLSARKNLEMLARISKVNIDRIEYVLDMVNLKKRCNDKVHTYSYGMKQRLGIAQTLLHNPSVIILDEPNNGLDPNGIDDMNQLIKKLKSEGKTICLSTHNLKDVEQICTHFTIFKEGENSVATSMEEQLKNSNKWLISINDTVLAKTKIEESKVFKVIKILNQSILIESKSTNTVNELNQILSGIEIYKISKESNLIEYFKND